MHKRLHAAAALAFAFSLSMGLTAYCEAETEGPEELTEAVEVDDAVETVGSSSDAGEEMTEGAEAEVVL